MQVFLSVIMAPDTGIDKSEVEQIFIGRLVLPKLLSALFAAQDHALAPFGLTARQGSLLLNCALGEAQTPAELARFQVLDISTVTRMVERLRRKGFVKRARDRRDRRRVIVSLTPAGNEVLKAAIPVAQQVAAKSWKGVTAAEKKALISITERVLKNLGHEPGLRFSN